MHVIKLPVIVSRVVSANLKKNKHQIPNVSARLQREYFYAAYFASRSIFGGLFLAVTLK